MDLGHVTMEFIGLVDFALKKESQPPTTRRRFQGNHPGRLPHSETRLVRILRPECSRVRTRPRLTSRLFVRSGRV